MYLPKEIEFDGKQYKLDWKASGNMDAFYAYFKTDLRFDSDEEAEDYAFINGHVDEIEHVDLWADGTARAMISA